MIPEQQKKRGGSRLVQTEDAAHPTTRPPKKKKIRTPKQKALRALVIAAVAVASLIILVGGAWLLFVKPPAPSKPIERPGPSAGVPDGTEPGQNVGGGDANHSLTDRKDNFFTFLLVGRDTYGGGNTDTMMLASYDVANQHLNVMSLPRDTLVNVSWDIKKLNSVYNMYGGKEKGMEALKEEIGQLVGFRPDFTVTVEWEAVGKLVDAVGGVYFDVPRRMYYNDLSQNFKIDLKKGPQTLNGSQAMQLLRYRHDSDDSGHILNSGYADGDLGRIKVQQDFLKATISQCLEKITDAGTVMKLAQVFMDNVTTDLNVGNLVWLGKAAIFGEGTNSRLGMENVSFITMPWVSADRVWSRTYNNHPSYVAPDVDEMMDIVNEHFNPYKTDLGKSELDIMYVNQDGTLGCTSGQLEDTKYNSWVKGKGSSSSGTKDTPAPSAPVEPSDEPTQSPSASPSDSPSASPDPSETPTSSPNPSDSPGSSPEPSDSPTQAPSVSPSASPSQPQEPSPSPVEEPPSEPPAPSSGGSDVPEGIPLD